MFGIGPLDREYLKSPSLNMDCENNYMGNEAESRKNKAKKRDAKNKL